jgi:hypothetical protein
MFFYPSRMLGRRFFEKRLTNKFIEGVYRMVYLTMTFPEGGKQDGILLASSKGQMRIALEGCTDVVELREAEGQWTLEDGTPVELHGMFTDGNTDLTLFSELYPRVLAAGHLGSAAADLSWSRYEALPAGSVH